MLYAHVALVFSSMHDAVWLEGHIGPTPRALRSLDLEGYWIVVY
jgi:hypothetical protein